ncbi:LacI family DNA-binding transcriptional regulator [Agromyces salentinus]|uniref:LacI family DNA-binding transcriptional regulator n=1 Tax=Agromyces salentinus TaxID=269421 RepID=A0ABN2MNZ7_9MICO|nr:LacI family DNA-binding transcriptional regulator [Agromyces salentinus]
MAQDKVTIKQVAAAAGVSITTVSHVLNHVPGKRIHPHTRERVLAEAARLGYTPNMLAQSLRTQRSHTIGLVGDEIATTPFAGKIILGAQDVATSHDSVVFVVNTGYERETEDREIEALLRRQVDGILYAAMYHRPVELPAKLANIPTVLINASCADRSVAWAVPDEAAGGEDAAEVLLSAGHRRLAFINDVDEIPAAFGREEGFRRRAAAWGLAQEDLRVVTAEADPAGGYEAARLLLDDAADRPSGIFCFNDRMAMGVYRAAAELDLHVPRDVSIVGFDNQDFIADGLHPGLTTVELPHYEMGVWAAKELFHQISSEQRPALAPTTSIRGPVIHRASVAPPAQGSDLGGRHQPVDRRGNA